MAYNVKYNKHTSYITRRVKVLKNGEKCKLHKIDWCERGLQLADIATTNAGDNYLNPIMKYIMVIIYN